nr:unnamed protein product [Digitaria exilis]
MATAYQLFLEAKRQEQEHQHLLQSHGGSALPPPPVYTSTALPLGQSSSVPPPAAKEPPNSGRSATEAQSLKIHSEAERRRRERINAHLAALRRMIPDPDAWQMDKATLLARVVRQLKDLKSQAAETRQPLPIPAEANDITIDCYTGVDTAGYGRPATYIRASISCDDRPGLLADLAGALRGLGMRPLRADMASLGGRARCELMLCMEEGDAASGGRVKVLKEGVRQVLANAAFPETEYGCNYRSRRQRVLESHCALGRELDLGVQGWQFWRSN